MSRIFGLITAAWVFVFFCILMPAPGLGLKCHVCESIRNESCDKLSDDRYLRDCYTVEKKNYTNCRKEVFSAFSKKFEMHTERTIRSCGIEKHPRLSCFYSSNKDLKGTTCECTEDGCNGGKMLQFATKVLLIVVLCGFLASLLAT